MKTNLEGATALVTGSTSNIGRAIAEALAAEGVQVVVSGRDAVRGEDVVDAIRAGGGRADFARADLDGSLATSTELAADATRLLGGRIDILVNNAGVYPLHSTASADGELFDRITGVNVKAPFFLTQAIVPRMIERGGGVVVNLGSWVARLAVASSPLYSSSKATLEALTRAWAAEFGPLGVRVNAVSPGVIRASGGDGPAAGMMATAPAGAAGTPEAVAAAVVFLASAESSFIHGTVLDVDGGRAAVFQSA